MRSIPARPSPEKESAMSSESPLLSVKDLSIAFHQGGKTTLAVESVSF
jgi:hypothetical protein